MWLLRLKKYAIGAGGMLGKRDRWTTHVSRGRSGDGSRHSRRAFALGLLAVALLLTVSVSSSPAMIATGTGNISVSVALLPDNPRPVAGVPFGIDVGIGNVGPDQGSARLIVDLPEGLTATSANRLGCPTGTGTLDCGRQELLAGDQSDGTTRLIAALPGSYTIVVQATDLTVTDPNPTNNTASTTISVGTPTPNPAVSKFALSPAKPRAGRRVKVSFAVVDKTTGSHVTPSAVRCAAVAAGAKVRGRGSVAAGRATCTFLPPRSARGKTLRGTISATAEGKRLRRAFAARLR